MKPAPQPLSKRIQTFGRRTVRRLSGRLNQQFSTRPAQILGFMLTITIITGLASGYSFNSQEGKIVDGVVRANLIAAEDFVYVDKALTSERRQEAAQLVPPIFEYDAGLRDHTVNRITTNFAEARAAYFDRLQAEFGTVEPTSSQLASPKYTQFVETLATQKPSICPLTSDPEVLKFLIRHSFGEDIERESTNLVSLVLKDFIHPDSNAAEAKSRRLIYQDSITRTQYEIRGRAVISQSAANMRLKETVESLKSLDDQEKTLFGRLLSGLIQPNIRYSPLLTEEARDRAMAGVPEISTAYRRNQIIARAGDPATPHIEAVIAYLDQKQSARNPFRRFIGLFAIVSILLFALHTFTSRMRPDLNMTVNRAFAVMCVTLVSQAVLIWFGLNISRHFGSAAGLAGDLSPYEFAVPYAAATLIVALLVNENLALLCAVFVGLTTSLMTNGSIEICLYAILSGSAAAYSAGEYRHRNAVIRAGVIVGLVNMLGVAAVVCLGTTVTFSGPVFWTTVTCGAVGGLITAAFASFAVPICETLFDILTDVKLLELSNADLPLLRELAMRAPGTQQHSVMVSSLAQEAAEAIGAHALLVRIGCYYHDIGKLLAPEMFIENQAGMPNPHDKMHPRRSASVITGHVRKGIIMGREANLPQEIIDLIPQHHGTRKLHYFFTKASEIAAETGESVDEADYRYPGPKPQTREAAIVMLADSAEAAARSLDEPTLEAIGAIVKRIFDDLIADGQLDECGITMREVTVVRETLVKTLCNIYHHRVTYPGFNIACVDSEEIGVSGERHAVHIEEAAEPVSAPPSVEEVETAKAAARQAHPIRTGEFPQVQSPAS